MRRFRRNPDVVPLTSTFSHTRWNNTANNIGIALCPIFSPSSLAFFSLSLSSFLYGSCCCRITVSNQTQSGYMSWRDVHCAPSSTINISCVLLPLALCQRDLSNGSVCFLRDEAWQNQALFLRLFITRFTHGAAALVGEQRHLVAMGGNCITWSPEWPAGILQTRAAPSPLQCGFIKKNTNDLNK